MRIKETILNSFIVILTLLLFEIFASVVIFVKEKKTGLLFQSKNFNKKQVIYKINWDNSTNKIIPGQYFRRLNDGRNIKYTINSKGFRNKEFDIKKKTDYRIIAFGGSTTMGIESPDNLTYPAILEQKLKNQNIDAEVLNFGFSSKSLNFIKDLIYLELKTYKPDFISIKSNRNSILYDSIGTKLKNNKIKYHKFESIILYLKLNIMSFRLLDKIYKKILSSRIDTEKITSPYNRNFEHNIYYFTDQYFDTIKKIVNYAEKLNIKVILIKQGFYINPKIQKELDGQSIEELLDALKNINKIKKYNLNYEKKFWLLTMTILNKQLERFYNNKNVILVDPLNELILNKKNFQDDFLHMSDAGNRIISDAIYEKIRKEF